MKRKLIAVLLTIVALCLSSFCFTACNKENDVPAKGGITMSKEETTLFVGGSETIIAAVSDKPDEKVFIWESYNPNVATVNANGKITAVAVGEALITATTLDHQKVGICKVTVETPIVAVESITVNTSSVELTVGEFITITATITPAEATNQNVVWASEHENIATVDNGVITAINEGTTTVSVTAEDGGLTATVIVRVIDNQERGNMTGRVYSASNNSAMSGVTVSLYKNEVLIATTTTNSSGVYTFNNVTYGEYELKYEKDGYITALGSCTMSSGLQQLDNTVIASSDNLLPGYISGCAKDANTANGISNITIYVRSGNGNVTGTVIATATTTSSGAYTTEQLAPGNYTLQFVDNSNRSEKYISTNINATVTGNATSYNNDATMYLPITEGQIKVILTWGESPSDLDSHLLIKRNGMSVIEVDYQNKSAGGAVLDVDDTTSFGPETTTININQNADYTFFVYRYSSTGNSLSDSGAKVRISIGNQTYEYNVPDGEGRYWKVFDFDGETGRFTFYNVITVNAPQ